MKTVRSITAAALASGLLAFGCAKPASLLDPSGAELLAPGAAPPGTEIRARAPAAIEPLEPGDRPLLGDPPRGAVYNLYGEGELQRGANAWCSYQVVRIVSNGDWCPVALNEVVCVALDPRQADGPATRRIRFTQRIGVRCIGRSWADLERVGKELGTCPTGAKKLVRCGQ